MKLTVIIALTIMSILQVSGWFPHFSNTEKPLGGGLKSCHQNKGICEKICETSMVNNSVATGGMLNNRRPACDKDGICHCFVEQAPNTSDKIRPPQPGEENSCKCNENYFNILEYPSVYHDRQNPESKYCVCFSVLRNKASPSSKPGKQATKRN